MVKNNREVLNGAPGILFVGSIVLGVGIGLLNDQVAAGAVIGVGVGFLLMGLVTALGSKKK